MSKIEFASEKVKIQDFESEIPPSITQKKFQELAKEPRLYLGELYDLEEIKSSITNITECLQNLGSKQKVSPIRNLAIEFENICQKALEIRESSIYIVLKNENNLVISEILMALYRNNYLRKSIYNELNGAPRSLRNAIVHCKKENVNYAEAIGYCQELKDGIYIFLKEVYFSDLLRNSKELINEFIKIPKYKYLSDKEMLSKILKLWKNEKLLFIPTIEDSKELTSFSGLIEISVAGIKHPIDFNSTL